MARYAGWESSAVGSPLKNPNPCALGCSLDRMALTIRCIRSTSPTPSLSPRISLISRSSTAVRGVKRAVARWYTMAGIGLSRTAKRTWSRRPSLPPLTR